MPDLMLAPRVFDRDLIARHLARRPAGHDDFVTRLVLADLEERLGTVTRRFEQALIMSPDARVLPRTGRSADGPFQYERVASVFAGDSSVGVPSRICRRRKSITAFLITRSSHAENGPLAGSYLMADIWPTIFIQTSWAQSLAS